MLELTVNIFNILGSASLVVSVVLLIRSLRETIRLARAANNQALVGISCPVYLAMIQDRQLATLFCRSATNFAELDAIDRHRYLRLLIWWLIFYENVYYQRREKLLDKHTFQPWWRDMRLFIREQHVGQHWKGIKDLFQEEFAREVSALIAAAEVTDGAKPLVEEEHAHG